MYNVVVVDDDRIVRKDIVQSINWKDYGFNLPYEASNGRDGLGLILKIVPEIVLTDVCMPFIDGITLIKLVREKQQNVKFIVLSNYSDYEYLRGALKFGAVDYLLKCNISPLDIKNSLQNMSFDKISETHDGLFLDSAELSNCSRAEIVESIAYIKEHYDQKISLKDVANHVCLSQSHFCRIFKQETGWSFLDYLNEVRIRHAKRMLSNTHMRICDLSESLGYSSCDYFSRVFTRIEGSLPSEYRKYTADRG